MCVNKLYLPRDLYTQRVRAEYDFMGAYRDSKMCLNAENQNEELIEEK
jgi:hypothetical protein